MARKHPSFPHPDPSTRIWRYIDLGKFMATVEYSRLYFPNAISFEDPLEGNIPQADIRRRQEQLRAIYPDAPRPVLEVGDIVEQRVAREHLYLSCWHMNECESAAMWKVYAQVPEAVAIQTTFGRLDKALGDERAIDGEEHQIFIGAVKYLDYNSSSAEEPPSPDRFDLIMIKRRSFEHERELRAVVVPPLPGSEEVLREAKKRRGIALEVDLNLLIENIYVAPSAPDYLRELLERIVQRYKLDAKVVQSELDAPSLV